MAKPQHVGPTTSRPVPYIIGIVAFVILLILIFWFLNRSGPRHPSNPTDGHTSSLLPPGVPA